MEGKTSTDSTWLSQWGHFLWLGQALMFPEVVCTAFLTSVKKNSFPAIEKSYLRNLPGTIGTILKLVLLNWPAFYRERSRHWLPGWVSAHVNRSPVFISTQYHGSAGRLLHSFTLQSKGTVSWVYEVGMRGLKEKKTWGLCRLHLPCGHPVSRFPWRKMLVSLAFEYIIHIHSSSDYID